MYSFLYFLLFTSRCSPSVFGICFQIHFVLYPHAPWFPSWLSPIHHLEAEKGLSSKRGNYFQQFGSDCIRADPKSWLSQFPYQYKFTFVYKNNVHCNIAQFCEWSSPVKLKEGRWECCHAQYPINSSPSCTCTVLRNPTIKYKKFKIIQIKHFLQP